MPHSVEISTIEGRAALMGLRRVAVCGALFVSLGPLSLGLYTPAMTFIATDLAADQTRVQMTLMLYVAGFSLAQPVAGPLSDGLGRRRILAIFISIYLAGSIIGLFASSRYDHGALIFPGLAILFLSSCGLCAVLLLGPPSAVLIIIPTAFFSFSLSLITPGVTLQVMEGRAENGGAAAAVLGLFQFGGGFAFAALGMALPSTVAAAAILPVLMSFIAAVAQVAIARR